MDSKHCNEFVFLVKFSLRESKSERNQCEKKKKTVLFESKELNKRILNSFFSSSKKENLKKMEKKKKLYFDRN